MSKTLLIFDHHHINIVNTRYQLQSLKARGLAKSLVEFDLGLIIKPIVRAKMMLHPREVRSKYSLGPFGFPMSDSMLIILFQNITRRVRE